jgi:putative transposase
MKRLETQHGVSAMSRVFGVSRSGYAQWREAKPSARAQANQELDQQIKAVFAEHQARYGSPRVQRVLQQRKQVGSENRVARRMKELGLLARKKRGYVPRTTDSRHGGPISSNLLLDAEPTRKINTVWRSDITYVATKEGWLYLAAVLDDCSRKIIGWASADHMESSLVCAALEQAWRERGKVAGVIVHTDRGVQYASASFRTALAQMEAISSMSRKANCYDNAAMESFWSTLKTECFGDVIPATRADAKTMIFEYIAAFYNRRRLHSSLNYSSPLDFELNLN